MTEMNKVLFSQTALDHIYQLRQELQVPEDYGLRLTVANASKQGIQYAMGFDIIQESDEVYEMHGLKVLVDLRDALHILGMKIEWKNVNGDEGFVFTDPTKVGKD